MKKLIFMIVENKLIIDKEDDNGKRKWNFWVEKVE